MGQKRDSAFWKDKKDLLSEVANWTSLQNMEVIFWDKQGEKNEKGTHGMPTTGKANLDIAELAIVPNL